MNSSNAALFRYSEWMYGSYTHILRTPAWMVIRISRSSRKPYEWIVRISSSLKTEWMSYSNTRTFRWIYSIQSHIYTIAMILYNIVLFCTPSFHLPRVRNTTSRAPRIGSEGNALPVCTLARLLDSQCKRYARLNVQERGEGVVHRLSNSARHPNTMMTPCSVVTQPKTAAKDMTYCPLKFLGEILQL